MHCVRSWQVCLVWRFGVRALAPLGAALALGALVHLA